MAYQQNLNNNKKRGLFKSFTFQSFLLLFILTAGLLSFFLLLYNENFLEKIIKLERVKADETIPAEFHGWIWSDMVVGWLSFNCANSGSCATSDFKVMTSLIGSEAPYIENPRISYENYCTKNKSTAQIGRLGFEWIYKDKDDFIERYDFQIDNNADFSSLTVEVSKSGLSVFGWGDGRPLNEYVEVKSPFGGDVPGSNELAFNTNYYWQVKVWNDKNERSDWAGGSFVTKANAYPWCQWDKSPAEVSLNEAVNIINNCECYDSANNKTACASYHWDIPNPGVDADFINGTDEFFKNPQMAFHLLGNTTVTSTVTDINGYSCDCADNVKTGIPLPIWKEISPAF